MKRSKYIDGHCHLGLISSVDSLNQDLDDAISHGVWSWVQGGIDPEDWARQLRLKEKYPGVIPCFGLHPYWVADHSDSECEGALDLLAKSLKDSVGIGEMGLDLRPHILKNSRERQITLFEAQIELAKVANKPMVLHLVRCHHEALNIFDTWGVPSAGGMVHSFSGSAPQASDYLGRGLHISVGAALLGASSERLKQALKVIPLDRLILETDSPDQCANPSVLLQVAHAAADCLKIPAEELLDISAANLRKLFRI